jgi:hypothetical protein
MDGCDGTGGGRSRGDFERNWQMNPMLGKENSFLLGCSCFSGQLRNFSVSIRLLMDFINIANLFACNCAKTRFLGNVYLLEITGKTGVFNFKKRRLIGF